MARDRNRGKEKLIPDRERKILVVLALWPSKNHPYITYLVSRLAKHYPNLELLIFRNGNEESGIRLIGEESYNNIIRRANYKVRSSYNPIAYVRPLFRLLIRIQSTYTAYQSLISSNMSALKAFMHLVYFNKIIGKTFHTIYFSAVQLMPHVCYKELFHNSKILASSRGQDFDLYPTKYNKYLADIDKLHVLGQYLKAEVLKRGYNPQDIYSINPAALPVISTYQEFDKFSEFFDSEKINILTVARLTWVKGLIYSIRAIAQVMRKHPDLNLNYTIVGEGPERENLTIECHRLGILENVNFTGWLHQNEIDQILSKCDIYLLLSISEGFNNSVLQAQSLGLPSIVSNAGGLPENVIHGVTGIVVNKYDVNDTARAIYELSINENKRITYGQNGRKKVEAHQSIEIQISNFVKFFDSVC